MNGGTIRHGFAAIVEREQTETKIQIPCGLFVCSTQEQLEDVARVVAFGLEKDFPLTSGWSIHIFSAPEKEYIQSVENFLNIT